MKYKQQRETIVAAAQGLSHGKSGNLSVRVDEGFLITPTGVANDDLTAEKIVLIDHAGEVADDQLLPSSEWRFHHDLYVQGHDDINAIVHSHSTYATVLACHQKEIPAFHYMIAEAGGDSIRCAEYATFGTQQLSDNIIVAIKNRKACLMANHGMLAVGVDLASTVYLASQVEELSKQYVLALQIGEPVLLSKQEMEINIEKFKTYGKQNDKS